jgi:hypothetical protein
MRKITEEEANNIPTNKTGRNSLIRNYLLNLNVGEIIFLERSDWKQKRNGPSDLISRMRKETKFDFICEKALDNSGWVIRRTK